MIPNGGNYYLNIKANGNWEFTISQYIPLNNPVTPTTLEGVGDDVVFFCTNSGYYKFTFNHNGSSNFIVYLNGQNLMVNEIGNYNGSTRMALNTDGDYALVIKEDGAWAVEIE